MGAKIEQKIDKIRLFLLFAGSAIWSLTMVKSGIKYAYGLGFWGPNGHDAIWHIALINHFVDGNFNMPVFASEGLKNYHIGFDLVLALISRFTTIAPTTLYFQIVPPILAFLIGFLTYKFVMEWRGSRTEALWATFFVYFGGSWGWLVNLVRGLGLGGESMFWSQQAISTLVNPPFAFSLILILLGLIYTLRYLDSPSRGMLFPVFLFGILIEIKVYAGLLVLGSLFVLGIWKLLVKKRWNFFKLFLGTFALSFVLFVSLNKESSGLVVFRPFWFLETMMGLSDRLGWQKFYSAMTNYRLGAVWFKTILAYGMAFFIFWFGNLGTRVFKERLIFKWIKNYKKLGFVEIFISVTILAGVLVPTFFLQKGTPWNTIQFMYYSLTFSGVLAGIALGEYIDKKKNYILPLLVIFLTLPTTIGTLSQYLPQRPPAMLSNDEISALNFLKKQPEGIVLTYPFDEEKSKEAVNRPPRPLYLYESTAYVSAFSGKDVYLEDQVNLNITGYNWQERRNKEINFLNTLDQNNAKQFLKDNDIAYIYWLKGQMARLGESQLGLKKIFENEAVDIYKVNLE